MQCVCMDVQHLDLYVTCSSIAVECEGDDFHLPYLWNAALGCVNNSIVANDKVSTATQAKVLALASRNKY